VSSPKELKSRDMSVEKVRVIIMYFDISPSFDVDFMLIKTRATKTATEHINKS
jgi:hypothetical protein